MHVQQEENHDRGPGWAITAVIGFVYAYLPTNAGQRITTTVQGPTDLLSAWQGYGVFALWTAALIVLAGYLLKRRDASSGSPNVG